MTAEQPEPGTCQPGDSGSQLPDEGRATFLEFAFRPKDFWLWFCPACHAADFSFSFVSFKPPPQPPCHRCHATMLTTAEYVAIRDGDATPLPKTNWRPMP